MNVMFSPAQFRQLHPQFADEVKYSDIYLQGAFNQACLLCNNTESSIIPYDPDNGIYERQTLLYMLVCHIVELRDKGTVGTLTSASEGSVSASFQVQQKNSAAWYMQTQCGYTYWQLTSKYRSGGMFIAGRKNH